MTKFPMLIALLSCSSMSSLSPRLEVVGWSHLAACQRTRLYLTLHSHASFLLPRGAQHRVRDRPHTDRANCCFSTQLLRLPCPLQTV
ncbi:hypothetical protein BKA63DRAFT_39939 [Paraphoma chrysanthemicola]|nr:hypothetical protein BKA63DRAFT_39939 [Paraphoma chrysanthemicola]